MHVTSASHRLPRCGADRAFSAVDRVRRGGRGRAVRVALPKAGWWAGAPGRGAGALWIRAFPGRWRRACRTVAAV